MPSLWVSPVLVPAPHGDCSWAATPPTLVTESSQTLPSSSPYPVLQRLPRTPTLMDSVFIFIFFPLTLEVCILVALQAWQGHA